ncbi:hypothetical protein AMTRI_Chr03g43540 [Amborella trichopoda]|uniref:Uncharacterized protein n=1 Tax=Amborella trichopoda TaxID=13333 RepID=W1PTP1_AMBTC|nr:uncharacterized protein LOC18439617 [Amborella trichopoda]ERN11423.1 hypothetical protein AMTR_s00022p00043220 [Amborella trichopoda]|eukprot:XP_006849842.1 uncharacterized protein LOC18439617 [Amborella trichopoda]
MGSCLSTTQVPLHTAKLVLTSGGLHEFNVPVTVDQVLQSFPSSFICHADQMYINDCIPPLKASEELQLGQIYFLLPLTKLHYPLEPSEMAALAVKASTALSEGSRKRGRRKKVAPFFAEVDFHGNSGFSGDRKLGFSGEAKTVKPGLSRSGSVRKLQRNASKRAKLAYRKFRLRLSTIHEGIVAEDI